MLEFIPVKLRLPLKFGAEIIDSLKIAHVEVYGLCAFTGGQYGNLPGR